MLYVTKITEVPILFHYLCIINSGSYWQVLETVITLTNELLIEI